MQLKTKGFWRGRKIQVFWKGKDPVPMLKFLLCEEKQVPYSKETPKYKNSWRLQSVLWWCPFLPQDQEEWLDLHIINFLESKPSSVCFAFFFQLLYTHFNFSISLDCLKEEESDLYFIRFFSAHILLL